MKTNRLIYKPIIFLALIMALFLVLIAPFFVSAAEEYPNGSLIRAQDDYKVYVIFNDKKRWLKNLEVFNSYNFKWENVKIVNSDTIKNIGFNNLVRTEGDAKVYALNDFGHKRHILNLDVFNSYNFKWEDVAVIAKEEISSYPESSLIRKAEDTRVYFLENNKKRWVNSIKSFIAHNFNWDEVHIVNDIDFGTYGAGEVLGEEPTEEAKAPVISNIQTTDITENSVKIIWETDKLADSKVNYSLNSPVTEAAAVSDSNFTESHSINLINLTPNTTYYYNVVSSDESGNKAVSGEKSFITLLSAPQVGENVRITTALGQAAFPAAVFTGLEYGLTWQDSREGENSEIYFTRLDADRRKTGNDINISNNPNKISSNPFIVWTGAEFGVVWSEYSSDSKENENGCYLYFIRLDANGVKQGKNSLITSDNYGSCPSNPSMVWTGSEYGVSWHENRLGLATSRIFFTKLNNLGEKQGEDMQISRDSISEDSSITWSGKEFGLVWKESLPASKIYFVRLDESGVKQDNEIKINNTGGASLYPSIIWNGSNYAVIWQGEDKENERQIYFVELDQNGNKPLDDIVITSNSLGNYSIFPSFIWTGNEFGVSWRQGEGSIYFVRLDASGAKKNTGLKISDASSGEAKHPVVVWNNLKNKYGIIWDDTRNNNKGEIYFSIQDASF